MSDDLRSRFQNLHEFAAAARAAVNDNVWDYIIGGSETETTLRRNRGALDRLALAPSALRDVSRVDAGTDFLGTRSRLPVAIAPVGFLDFFQPDGHRLAARAAAEFGVPIFLNAIRRIDAFDEIPGQRFLQLYAAGDGDWLLRVADQARDHGFAGLAITVDNAVGSRRERDIAKRFVKQSTMQLSPGIEPERSVSALTWGDIEHLTARTDLPIILKGIGTAADARRATDAGADVVYVSNHGGRQLDHGPGTTEVLPEIIAAVAGRARVIVDGGFSRGTDVLKAIALGADLVVVGRLYVYALAAAGRPGVVRMLEILEDEIERDLALVGAPTPMALDSSAVRASFAVADPSVLSAFPLLGAYGRPV